MGQTRIPGAMRLLAHRNLSYVFLIVALLALGILVRLATSNGAPPLSSGGGSSATTSAQGIPSFARDVAPILDRSCVRCHGEGQADKGLRLDSYRRALAGDSYGAVLIPGKSSLSAIVSVVKYGTMPHNGVKLPSEEISILSRWIDAGAPEN